jgi:hypothetical protein
MISAIAIASEQAWHSLRSRKLVLAVLLGLAPGSAWACRPNFHHIDEPTLFEGPDGETLWKHDTYRITGITQATDLGEGYVAQHLIDGNECYAELATVLQNCATGEAVSYGGQMEAMIPGPRQEDIVDELDALLEERVQSGRHLTVAEISATAAERGVDFVVPMGTTSLIRLGSFEFRLGEACQVLYPDLPGAS